MANECWEGHFDAFKRVTLNGAVVQEDPRLVRKLLGNETVVVTYSGNCDPQAFLQAHQRQQKIGTWQGCLQSVGNFQQEHLIQDLLSIAPLFRANQVNGYGVLRFSRKDSAGTAGKSMHFYSAKNKKRGFESPAKNPFGTTSNANSGAPGMRGVPGEFTLFVLVRTRSLPGHTGDMGIVSVVGGAGATTGTKGFTLYKSPATCTTGAEPPECVGGRFTSFPTFNLAYGNTPAKTDSGCAAACGLKGCSLSTAELASLPDCGCEKARPHAGCANTWPDDRSARHRQDPDGKWRLVAVRARPSLVEGFVDGLHSQPAPMTLAGQTAFATSDALRIGAFDVAANHPPAAGHLSGDIAEILMYDKALTSLEMDRIAHYIRAKYDLGDSIRIAADVAFPFRTMAVSKSPGCPLQPTACNKNAAMKTPYARNAPIVVRAGEPASLARDETATVCPWAHDHQVAEGVMTISGWWLLPSDLSTSSPPAAMPGGATALDILMAERHLKVTLGPLDQKDSLQRPVSAVEASCKIWQVPRGHWRCSEGDDSSWGELGGVSFGRPSAVAAVRVGSSLVYVQDGSGRNCSAAKLVWHPPVIGDLTSTAWASEEEGLITPTLRCVVPGGIGTNRQLNIFWHGVRTSLPVFEGCAAPTKGSNDPSGPPEVRAEGVE